MPIPDGILQLGEDDPHAPEWLRVHWGAMQLRAVRIREESADRRLRRKAEIIYEFRSADWTPWQAILRLRRIGRTSCSPCGPATTMADPSEAQLADAPPDALWDD